MAHLVTTTGYMWRKKIDNFLYLIFPKSWIPLYTMVTFSRIRYSEVVKKREDQNKVLQRLRWILGISSIVSIGVAIKYNQESVKNCLTSINFKKFLL
jgi:kynurenine 3-monooxygenase